MKNTFGGLLCILVAMMILVGCASQRKPKPGFATLVSFSPAEITPSRIKIDPSAVQISQMTVVEYPDPVAALQRGDHIDPNKVIGQEDVVLHIILDQQGKLIEINRLEGSEAAGAAAIKAVQQWKFKPPAIGPKYSLQFETTIRVNVSKMAVRTPTVEVELEEAYLSQDETQKQEEARLLRRINPQYPAEAITQHIEGDVIVEFHIDNRGNVKQTTTVGDPMLAEAALQAIRQWKYRPQLRNGIPVEVPDAIVTVKFRL